MTRHARKSQGAPCPDAAEPGEPAEAALSDAELELVAGGGGNVAGGGTNPVDENMRR